MTIEQIEELAKSELSKGNNNFAILLYTYLGAVQEGRDSELAEYLQYFAKSAVHRFEYNRWVKNG